MSRLEKVLALLTALPFGLGFALSGASAPDGEVVFSFADPEIIESSGLVVRDGAFATVNDSGDGARVFTVDPGTGETVGETTWPAEPWDIEALAPLPGGDVLVGDIGDNLGNRDAVTVTRVPVGDGQRSAPGASYDLTFPDGPHDAESLLVHPSTGRVFVASKEFIGRLYAAPEQLSDTGPNLMERLGEVMPISTDGAFFPDGQHFVLRDYGQARIYSYPALEEVGEVDLPPQEQGEGIAIDEDGEVYVSSEGVHSEVLRIPLPERLRAEVDGTTAEGGSGDGTTDEGGSGDDAAEEGGSGGGPADEADRAGPAEPTDPDEGDSWTGIVLSPWLVGGAAFLVILLVLLRSLRPR